MDRRASSAEAEASRSRGRLAARDRRRRAPTARREDAVSGAPASAGARKWRTSGTVSIRQAEAASAIGSIDPVALIAQAPTSKAR